MKLPIKGHEVNPIEMLNNYVQILSTRYDHGNKKGIGCHSFPECEIAVTEQMKYQPEIVQSWFHMFGDGTALQQRWEHDPDATGVIRRRSRDRHPTIFKWLRKL